MGPGQVSKCVGSIETRPSIAIIYFFATFVAQPSVGAVPSPNRDIVVLSLDGLDADCAKRCYEKDGDSDVDPACEASLRFSTPL